MFEFDSDFLKLPLVPFIVELPVLCFKVHIPMSLAAQQEDLPYFELIQTPIKQMNGHFNGEIKNIGHKCFGFFATCSVFVLIGDGYTIYYEPYNWHYERKIDIKNNILSLDDAPAADYEAWEIYLAHQKHEDSRKVEKMIELLDSDQIKADYIKKHFPDFIGHYEASNRIDIELINRFEKSIARNVLRDKKIVRAKKRVEISEINLLMSFQYIFQKQSTKNETLAIKEAILLFYPDINEDDFAAKYKALYTKINYRFKDSEEIEFLYGDTHNTSQVDKIKHHFEGGENLEPPENDEENEFYMIMKMIKDGCFQ